MLPVIPVFSAEIAERGLDLSASIGRVLDRHRYILGAEVAAFERAFADYCGVAECVAVANGTDALEIAMAALSLGPGDPVAMVANAGPYGSCAARNLGVEPRYVEIDPQTRTMAVDALAAAIEEAKAVIVTHLFGQLGDVEAIVDLAAGHGVPVIEDCAQSHGAMREGRRAGSFGTVGTFSFYPTKNLGALGDGGALVTNDVQLAARMRALRQYGWTEKYRVTIRGGRNSRLDEMQAAVLLDKLRCLDGWNEQRRAIARRYVQAFSDLPMALPPSTGTDSVSHLFVIEIDDRDAFRARLLELGVATDVHYPVADHCQPAYRAETADVSLPATESSCDRVVSLPCYPGMSEEDMGRVIQAVRAACEAARS